MNLAAFTNQQLICPELKARDAAGAIAELTQALHRGGVITNSLAFYHAALNREFLTPTQFAPYFSFPHARSPVVTRLALAVGRSSVPMDWGNTGAQIRLVFLAAIPPSTGAGYLALVRAFAHVARNPVLRDRLIAAVDTNTILSLLDQADGRREPAGRTRRQNSHAVQPT